MPNIFAKFQQLIPSSPTVVGTVSHLHTNGTCSVTMPGDGTMRVIGEVAVGKKVFIKEGVVQGEAPDLPFYELEV